MVEQGVLLVLVSLIIIVIGGVILFVFSISFATSIGATDFGAKCYFSFVEYNVVDSFLYPVSFISSALVGKSLISDPIAASQVQGACTQNSNVNAQDTSTLAEQIYTKAASCFNLFQGSNAGEGADIIYSGLNQLFECYAGTILNSETPGSVTTYNELINYINQNYPNNGNPLQIVFITNGTDGLANYTNPNAPVANGSTYVIYYFGYPSTFSFSASKITLNGVSGTDCTLNFNTQCDYVSQFNEPDIGSAICNIDNPTVYKKLGSIDNPVSSLSTPSTLSYDPKDNVIGACEDYVIAFCGRLLNTMVLSQNRVFVCITNSALG